MTKLQSLLLTTGISIGGIVASGAFAPAQAVSFLNTFSSPGTIGEINSATGVFTPVITNGPSSLTDIALSSSGELFGTTFSELYKFNTSTQTSTLVGATGATINGLGFAANGNLYGTGGSNFYQINAATGAATQVGSSIANFSSAGDIVFNPNTTNQFLALSLSPDNSTLFSINSDDGTATAIGNIGIGNVYGAFFEGGQLFGYTDDRRQIKIDLATGAGTFDRDVTGTSLTIGGAASLATITPPQPTAVPEPFTIVGTLVGGSAALRMRKQLKSRTKS